MNRGWIFVMVAVIAVLAIVYFVNPFSDPDSTVGQNPTNAGSSTLKVINAKREFLNGKHTVSGVIDLPTPCHGLVVETTVAESYPEQVALNFYSTTTAEQCVQVVTPVQFMQEFDASGYAIIRAFWNGEPAKLQFTN